MKQITKQHACSKRAVYLEHFTCSNVSISVRGSDPSRAMPSSRLRQAFVRIPFSSDASIYDARCLANTACARPGPLSPLSNDSFYTPLKKPARDFHHRCGSAYEVVVFEKLIT
jgi:hypothetical protein